MSSPYKVNVLEQWHVSPPSNSVSPTCLPLTFFDMPWHLIGPSQTVLFYELPFSTSHITQNTLPNLKHSLSLTFQHFFPFVGNLVCPMSPAKQPKPHFQYKNGDSVTLTIAESTGKFEHLVTDSPKDIRELHKFVPDLPHSSVSSDGNVEYFPLVALQITIFPESGICLGFTTRHVLVDGMTLAQFLKSWASISRSNKDILSLEDFRPSYDRDVVKDPSGLEDIFWEQCWTLRSNLKQDDVGTVPDVVNNNVRATFLLNRDLIERLKQWIFKQCKDNNEPNPPHCSAFVVSCAFVWVCLIKSLGSVSSDLDSFDDECPFWFEFTADCRNGYELSIPENYVGNCIVLCFVSTKKKDLMGENGVLSAAKAIGSRIRELESGVLKGAETWLSLFQGLGNKGYHVSIAGSPKLSVYETDFGWGKAKKWEVVTMEVARCFSLAESRDKKGGVEIGVTLSSTQMKAFTSIFKNVTEIFCFNRALL